jgi:hypothetical protein
VVLTALDDIAWLFNTRGNKMISHNLVFYGYAYAPTDPITPSSLYVHCHERLRTAWAAAAARPRPDSACVVKPYAAILGDATSLAASARAASPTIPIDERCNQALVAVLKPDARPVVPVNPGEVLHGC